MSKALITATLRHLDRAAPCYFAPTFIAAKTITSKATQKKIAVSFKKFDLEILRAIKTHFKCLL